MNKKLFLLPFLTLSLALAGCSLHGGDNKPEEEQPAAKEIWEQDLVEGESTFAQVKEGAEKQYFVVRGTVAANSGSTFALYRNGEFLYCYNFKAEATPDLADHKLGAYVEVKAQSSKYEGSTQLTAYDVGNKNTAKYDQDAYVKVLADRGQPVTPKAGAAEADFANAAAAGALMKVNFVPKKDMTFDLAETSLNQDLPGKVGEFDVTLRLEKYLPADTRTAIFAAEGSTKFEMGNTYEVTALAAATSSGSCRLMFVDASVWSKTAEATWDAPTSVVIEAEGDKTSMEVGQSLQLDFTVLPATAKPAVTWSSEDESIMTVNEEGLVKAKAVGTKKIFALAANSTTVKGEYTIEVKAASKTITLVKAPAANTTYKAGIHQTSIDGEPIYFINGQPAGNFVGVTDNVEEAIDVKLIPVTGKEGKFHLECKVGTETKYGNFVVSGNYVNFKYEATASTEYELYELQGTGGVKTIAATVSGCGNDSKNGLSYLGTYGSNTTLSISRTSYIEGETNSAKIDRATDGQYPLHFYTVA